MISDFYKAGDQSSPGPYDLIVALIPELRDATLYLQVRMAVPAVREDTCLLAFVAAVRWRCSLRYVAYYVVSVGFCCFACSFWSSRCFDTALLARLRSTPHPPLLPGQPLGSLLYTQRVSLLQILHDVSVLLALASGFASLCSLGPS